MSFRIRLFCLFLILLGGTGVRAQPQSEPSRQAIADSLRSYRQKLHESPKNPALLNRIGYFLLLQNRTDSADVWLQLSRKIDPNNPETYYLIGRSYYQKGKLGIIPIEKLLALLKQDFQSKAIRNFEKAVSLRPDFPEAYYYLGRAHLKKEGTAHFQQAVQTFQKLLEMHPGFRDTKFQLAIAFHDLKQYDRALQTLNEYYNEHPDDGRPFIEMSRIYLETNRPREASHYFMEGVVKLRDPETLNELFLEIKDIATPQEKKEYERLPLDKKGLFFKRFWKRRDPTPLTEENERFTEHFRRVQFARQVFHSIIPPYYDDRGRIYVKYGQPDARYVSTMSGMKVRDNESWSYEKSIRRGLVFDFVETGGGFRLVQDLTQAAISGVGYGERLAMAARLYEDRATTLGGSYNRFSLGFKENDLVDFTNMKIAAEAEAPVEVFHYDYHADPLPFQVRIAQFRGQNGRTRVELYHSVIARDLEFTPYLNSRLLSSVVTTAAVFDTLYDEIDRKSSRINLIARSKEEVNKISNLDQMNFLLKPAEYHIVIQKENPEGNKLGIRKYRIRVRPFSSDSLEISDLELAYRVKQATRKDQFYKDGLRILPYTFRQHDRTTPIILYYEIYNLSRDANGKTKYEISYKATSILRKENALKKFFHAIGGIFGAGKAGTVESSYQREGDQATEKQYISLDVHKMPPGIIELAVSVKDLHTGQSAASKTRLEIIQPKR